MRSLPSAAIPSRFSFGSAFSSERTAAGDNIGKAIGNESFANLALDRTGGWVRAGHSGRLAFCTLRSRQLRRLPHFQSGSRGRASHSGNTPSSCAHHAAQALFGAAMFASTFRSLARGTAAAANLSRLQRLRSPRIAPRRTCAGHSSRRARFILSWPYLV
jgi:hypothetical protein